MRSSALQTIPQPHQDDRRVHRSECTGTALNLALHSAARRGNLEAMLLADEQGLLIANSNTSVDVEAFAAAMPLIQQGQPLPNMLASATCRPVCVRAVTLQQTIVYVAAVGEKSSESDRELTAAMGAAQRILTA